jgi:hypothetical protein
MHPNLDRAINEIDAAVFNGDTFEDPDERKELLEWLERWCKRLGEPFYGKQLTFDEAWAEYEKRGYQYGHEALENVKFGWSIAKEAMSRPHLEEGDDDDEGSEGDEA